MKPDRRPLVKTSEPACATEPIHIPGSIQPHGLLLLFAAASGKLDQWAGDFDRLLGLVPTRGAEAPALLGSTLDELIQPDLLIDGGEATSRGCIQPAGRAPLALQAHRTGDHLCIELQGAGQDSSAVRALETVRDISGRIDNATTLTDACHVATEQVRQIIGFDRVMAYRFLEDGSGSVIAESRIARATSYLGHRFPSGDIPRPARELYLRNLIRAIPDVAYKPWPIQPGETAELLDMSHCVLRSVAPVHIQYLKNMGVGASMSISLLVNGELWGLIVCHHAEQRAVPIQSQLLCRHVGSFLSAFILSSIQAESARFELLQRVALEWSLRNLRSSSDPERTLESSAAELKKLVPCGGFVLLANGEAIDQAGHVPGTSELRLLAPLVEEQLSNCDSYRTDRLSEALLAAPLMASTASGVLAIHLVASRPLLAMWLRPEQVEEISWAGDPRLKEVTEPFAALTPRRSFATWLEIVGGRSRPWLWHEINAVETFQSRAGYTIQRNRLKQLNLELADANAELSALATTDPLTGLSNRRLFEERMTSEWHRALRQETSLGIVVIDVDHFKLYNDRYGHPAGDKCLRQVAAAIDGARRAVDVVARMGGEEFALLLPDADLGSTATVAERVRLSIEQLGLQHLHDDGCVVTVSIGTAVGSPAQTREVADLMIAADRALYEAKENGRNRVAASA
jgi:diguanylate cyclase (GGDEF)-like protein